MSGPGVWTPPPPPGPSRRDRSNLIVAVIVVVTVLVLGALAEYAFSGHRRQTAGPPSSTGTRSSGAVTATATTTVPSTTVSSVTASPRAEPSTAKSSRRSPTRAASTKAVATTKAAATTSSRDPFSTCSNSTADLDLINLTVALQSAPSFASASGYERALIKSCTVAKVRAQLGPYFGTTYATAFTDLTGNDNAGPIDRYRVQVVNTKRFVTFTMKRKVATPGFALIAVSG